MYKHGIQLEKGTEIGSSTTFFGTVEFIFH